MHPDQNQKPEVKKRAFQDRRGRWYIKDSRGVMRRATAEQSKQFEDAVAEASGNLLKPHEELARKTNG